MVLTRKPKNASKRDWIGSQHNLVHLKSLCWCLPIDSWSRVHSLHAGKRLLWYLHFYLFTLLCISDDLAPRLIQSIRRNVHNRKKIFETVVNSNIKLNLSLWIGEQPSKQMNFWHFFRNITYVGIPEKLSDFHLHALFFSNPQGKLYFLLKSMGQICPPDLILLETFPRGLENHHACKWISDNFLGITEM